MQELRLMRRHSVQPAVVQQLEPWRNDTPFLPVHLFREQKSKIKSLPLKLKKYESLLQLQSHQMRPKEKLPTKVSQEMHKININLYNSKKTILRTRLPLIERDKTQRMPTKLRISQDSRELTQELNIQRKIFLLMHEAQPIITRRSQF